MNRWAILRLYGRPLVRVLVAFSASFAFAGGKFVDKGRKEGASVAETAQRGEERGRLFQSVERGDVMSDVERLHLRTAGVERNAALEFAPEKGGFRLFI